MRSPAEDHTFRAAAYDSDQCIVTATIVGKDRQQVNETVVATVAGKDCEPVYEAVIATVVGRDYLRVNEQCKRTALFWVIT